MPSDPLALTRRYALRMAALGVAGSLPSRTADSNWTTKHPGDPFGGLNVGLTTFSTRKLSLDDTVGLLAKVGVENIALKSFHLPLRSSPGERAAVRRQLADAGLELRGCGVVGLKNDEADMRRKLDYVRDMGAAVVTVTIPEEAFTLLDRVVKDYDIRVAVHTHGPEDQKADGNRRAVRTQLDYWRWDATRILPMIEGLDRRIGVCVDVGHTFRLPLDPIKAIRECGDRLYDIHLKDLKEASRRRLDVPLGRGVVDIRGVLRALQQMNYAYHVALEYEAEPAAPQLGIAESFGFLRGVLGTS